MCGRKRTKTYRMSTVLFTRLIMATGSSLFLLGYVLCVCVYMRKCTLMDVCTKLRCRTGKLFLNLANLPPTNHITS